MFLMIVIRALTLEGATMGLDALFKPDWSSMLDGKVWVAAYGQIFFSLSIGFAIMITYSSYLPKKSDINNNAFIAGFSNSGFELLAGIGVFAALGFMANAQGVDVDQVADGGIGLAFIVFPQIINTFPGFNTLFGVLFFGSLVLAGLSSLISIVQTYVAALQEKFNISRTKAVLFGGGLSAVLSIVFATDSGLDFLDVVDYFINSFGIVLAGLVSVVAIAWFVRNLDELQNHANAVSDLKTGLWWKLCLSVVTPLVLGYMLFDSLRQTIIHGYGIGRFTLEFNFYWGWLVAIAVFVFGVLFSIQKKENQGLANTAEKTSKGVNAE